METADKLCWDAIYLYSLIGVYDKNLNDFDLQFTNICPLPITLLAVGIN